MRRGSFISDYIEFEEFLERRDELLKKKKESRDKKPRESKGLGFFEGLLLATAVQVMYGPLTKLLGGLVTVYLQAHGVH